MVKCPRCDLPAAKDSGLANGKRRWRCLVCVKPFTFHIAESAVPRISRIAQLAKAAGINRSTLYKRIYDKGLTLEEALARPVRPRRG